MKLKGELYLDGLCLMSRFCEANELPLPKVTNLEERWHFKHCAYYRPDRGIVIHIPSCAHIGTCGQAWSYPGYFIDRTPYGVIQHELGHHVDFTLGEQRGSYGSEFSGKMRKDSGEEKLTNYCPNDWEWFAEMFRLFATNSELLKFIRPKTYALMCKRMAPVEVRPWREVLASAPARNIQQCEKRAAAVNTGETPALLC